MMLASVVDLPLPVGPVTRRSPFCFLEKSSTMGGSPSPLKSSISKGIWRIAMLVTPRCWNTFALKRESPCTPKEKSSSFSFSNRFCCSSVMMLYAICLLTSGVITG